MLSFTLAVHNDTTLHGVHTDTVVVSPTVLIKCSICSCPYLLTRTRQTVINNHHFFIIPSPSSVQFAHCVSSSRGCVFPSFRCIIVPSCALCHLCRFYRSAVSGFPRPFCPLSNFGPVRHSCHLSCPLPQTCSAPGTLSLCASLHFLPSWPLSFCSAHFLFPLMCASLCPF